MFQQEHILNETSFVTRCNKKAKNTEGPPFNKKCVESKNSTHFLFEINQETIAPKF
jgi:hypothetical protein